MTKTENSSGFDYRIYRWGLENEEPTIARAVIIRRPNYGESLDAFLLLATEAKKHFPNVKDSDILLGKINGSGYMDGHAVITFSIPFNSKIPEVFAECGETMDFHY